MELGKVLSWARIVFVLVLLAFISGSVADLSNTPVIRTKPNKEIWVHEIIGYNPEYSLSELRLDIKGKFSFKLRFYDKDKQLLLMVLFGGYRNTKSEINIGSQVTKHLGKVLEPTQFRSFKVEYVNESVNVYNHNAISWVLMMKMQNVLTFKYCYLSLQNKNANEEWIIKPAVKFLKSTWRTNLSLRNIKFLDNVAWVKQASHIGICVMFCNADRCCKSFSFNHKTLRCQGHSENYFNILISKTEIEQNTIHYHGYEF